MSSLLVLAMLCFILYLCRDFILVVLMGLIILSLLYIFIPGVQDFVWNILTETEVGRYIQDFIDELKYCISLL